MFSSNTSAANGAANYIEDVFQTWLYAGTGSTQTITNGIDLAGKGGLVWIKTRTNDPTSHVLIDTVRGNTKLLSSNNTGAQVTTPANVLTSFNATGFSLGADTGNYGVNFSSDYTYASWTFRKQPKFFDVVTYTGNGANGRAISHNLGSTPGFIVVKRTNNTGNWYTWHRAHNGGNNRGALNSAGNFDPAAPIWGDGTNYIAPTSTTFTVSDYFEVNGSGDSFVAYLFAHNAGGFGLTGTDNVISCGSFTTDGSGNATVNLGYEPQWVLIKRTNGAEDWYTTDNMRGWSMAGGRGLSPNRSAAEFAFGDLTYLWQPTATGFLSANGMLSASSTYIYIAIRRGPMKTPTTGTSVFAPVASASGGGTITTGFVTDSSWSNIRAGNSNNSEVASRLTGWMPYLRTASTAAESNAGINKFKSDSNTGFTDTLWEGIGSTIYWNFRRAPGFFDEVCYTGTGSARTVAHNLAAVPELMIVKSRSLTSTWPVYTAATGATNTMDLSSTGAATTLGAPWSGTSPTASVFTISGGMNTSGATYVAYLFASCPGVSKVFNFTGNGSSQTINCGFTGGARFVMIKRTDSTGDWYVWDSARGIVSGNDPRLSLNTTAAEVTTDDSVDTDSTGFVVNQLSATNVNVNGASYIGLAIA